MSVIIMMSKIFVMVKALTLVVISWEFMIPSSIIILMMSIMGSVIMTVLLVISPCAIVLVVIMASCLGILGCFQQIVHICHFKHQWCSCCLGSEQNIVSPGLFPLPSCICMNVSAYQIWCGYGGMFTRSPFHSKMM
jgi:hypothetical protein